MHNKKFLFVLHESCDFLCDAFCVKITMHDNEACTNPNT